MTTYQFTIRVDGKQVAGRYGAVGEEHHQVGKATLNPEPLALRTVGLLNRWLSLWGLAERSTIRLMKTLLESDALVVLGTYLWRLILDNEVGEELKNRVPAEGAQTPLRLSIEFTDGADPTLRGLPWEFLYEPDNEWHLAAKTELLLTRYVTTDKTPASVEQADEKVKLRALLIAALPRNDAFAVDREALNALRTALNDLENLDVPEPIEAWDAAVIAAELNRRPYHVVHVIGICRGTPEGPKIYLGGVAKDGLHDPAQFVDTITANTKRPGLVILQLCDYVDGDATDNFERIAPALIKRRVPAVLALQYAARTDQAENVGLGTAFYKSLVNGEHIGAAVQASRKRLWDAQRDPRFGTPVLYLQEDVVLRRPGSGAGALPPSTAPPKTEEVSVQEALIRSVLDAKDLPDAQKFGVLTWISRLDSKASPREVANTVREKLREPPDRELVDLYLQMFVVLGDLKRGT